VRRRHRARGGHHQAADAPDPLEHCVDHLSRAGVGPVQVVEQEHERLLFGERLQQLQERKHAPAERLATYRRVFRHWKS
jgi:hypothetical protein